jgi:hypothetical protein
MKMILLTKEQAEKVRGRHGRYSALDPISTGDGNFMLGMEVLDDPEHDEVLDDLLKCEEAEIDIIKTIDEKVPIENIFEREKTVYNTLSTKALDYIPKRFIKSGDKINIL